MAPYTAQPPQGKRSATAKWAVVHEIEGAAEELLDELDEILGPESKDLCC